MLITKETIKDILFPVYILPSMLEVVKLDGILWYNNRVIDDTNQPGDTLGIRRLQTPHKVQRLKKGCSNIVTLIKSCGNKKLIDSSGLVFRYRKTSIQRLVSHKISSVVLKTSKSVVRVKGVNQPFIVPNPPRAGAQYASILYNGRYPWLIYNYTNKPIKTTRRSI